MRLPSGERFDLWVTIAGSLIFCLLPLWYMGFKVNRRLRWKTYEPRTILVGVLSGFAWFTFFLSWLGPLRGPYFASAALIGWFCGVWQAARRNERKKKLYSRPVRRKRSGGIPVVTATATGTETNAEEKAVR